jgi:Tfp pilus assembly protein PilE
MRKNFSGFSIPELLIVIVTIGILAGIVIISYNGIQNRGYDASIRSDFDALSGTLEAYRQRTDGTNDAHEYPRDAATLQTLSIKASKAAYNSTVSYNFVMCVPTSGPTAYKEYRVIALSKSGAIFVLGQDGLVTNSLTAANITSTVCNTSFSMGLVSNGLSAPNTWQSWVGSS